jgi:hypothetical protein
MNEDMKVIWLKVAYILAAIVLVLDLFYWRAG